MTAASLGVTARRKARARFAAAALTAASIVWGGVRPAVLTAQSNAATPGAIRSYSTISSIGVEWTIGGDADHDAAAAVDFRVAGTSSWRAALPLVRVDYNGANMLAGSVLFLNANTAYDVRLTLSDPDAAPTFRPSPYRRARSQ
jgi:hypothetical protein